VLGDVLDAARNRVSGRHDVPFSGDLSLHYVPAGELSSVFYLSVDVIDRPGVLAEVAGHLRATPRLDPVHGAVRFGDEARLSFLTHRP
jgi:homoserine dehydrogenase